MATTLLDLFVLVVIVSPLVFRIFLEVFIDDGYLVPIPYKEFDESCLREAPRPQDVEVLSEKYTSSWLTPNLFAASIGTPSSFERTVVIFLIVFLRDDVKVNPHPGGGLPSLSYARKMVKATRSCVFAPFMGVETCMITFLRNVIIFVLFVDLRQKLLGKAVEDVLEDEISRYYEWLEWKGEEADRWKPFLDFYLDSTTVKATVVEVEAEKVVVKALNSWSLFPDLDIETLTSKEAVALSLPKLVSFPRKTWRTRGGTRVRKLTKKRHKLSGAQRRLLGN